MRERICGIYKITSPSKKIYIGQSRDILKRWNEYKRYDCRSQIKLFHSIKKYGAINHLFDLVCVCDKGELNEKEKYYVDLYQTFNSEYGLNLRDGGGACAKQAPESIKKSAKKRTGRKRSLETRKKISLAKLGTKQSQSTKNKRIAAHIGRKNTPNTIEKMRTTAKNKSIIVYDENNNTQAIYRSISEASRTTGYSIAAISLWASGGRRSMGGFIVKYV